MEPKAVRTRIADIDFIFFITRRPGTPWDWEGTEEEWKSETEQSVEYDLAEEGRHLTDFKVVWMTTAEVDDLAKTLGADLADDYDDDPE